MVSANCLHCSAESVTCRGDVTETRMRVTHQACILRNYAKFCGWQCLMMGDALGDALPVSWLWSVVASALVVCVCVCVLQETDIWKFQCELCYQDIPHYVKIYYVDSIFK